MLCMIRFHTGAEWWGCVECFTDETMPRLVSHKLRANSRCFIESSHAREESETKNASRVICIFHPLLRSPIRQTAECLHTMAMIQQAENPQIGETALGSQKMALEVSRHIGDK